MTSYTSRRREFLAMVPAGLAAMMTKLYGAEQQVIPFLDAPKFDPAKPRLPWEQADSWITADDQLFWVGHYGFPEVDAAAWKLEIGGLVERPRSFTLAAIRALPKKELTLTIECSGNPAAGGMVGNARWTGTPLAPILKECGLKPEAIEFVFFGADEGTEKIRNADYKQKFARTLTAADALRNDVLICYEMNRKPLEKNHGAPVRLVVPGWYGVAWVKWLTRIEALDRPYLNRFTGRDYVTIRGEQRGNDVVWRETSVGRMNLKSVPARVIRTANGALQVAGAAWSDGTPIRTVEVKIDDGAWKPAKLIPNGGQRFAWTFWSYDWADAQPGEHSVSSRATDARGRVQPAPDDPFIAMKKTYWESNQQAVRKVRI